MSIINYITQNAQEYGKEEAIVYVNSDNVRYCLTWSQLEAYSNKIANMLITKGIKKGEKVAIMISNSLFWLPIYFGVLKVGAVVVPLNYRKNIDEISYYIEYAECRAVFLSATYEHGSYLETIGSLQVFKVEDNIMFWNREYFLYSHSNVRITLKDEEVAAIYFSSGTTGKEKAILLSHGALKAAAEIEASHHFQQQSDRFLCLTPLYHTGSKIHWFGSLTVGGAIVICESTSPSSILNIVQKESISIAWLLVHQIQDVLDAIDSGDINISSIDISSLRLMHSGSQPIPASLILRWHKKFPNILYDTNYGLTEATGPGCIHLGVENIDKAGAIGKPDARWSAKIVNNDGVSVERGIVGELVIKGPGVMLEYYKDKEATNETLREGWLYTGDMAYMDDNGFIYLVDRKKDIIICGGENIYPVQIENYLRTQECVKDVAVIGLPNKRMGEMIGVVIEVKENYVCSKNEIHRYCERLPEHQRPLRVYFGRVIRNATGKIDKKLLREYIVNNKKVW